MVAPEAGHQRAAGVPQAAPPQELAALRARLPLAQRGRAQPRSMVSPAVRRMSAVLATLAMIRAELETSRSQRRRRAQTPWERRTRPGGRQIAVQSLRPGSETYPIIRHPGRIPPVPLAPQAVPSEQTERALQARRDRQLQRNKVATLRSTPKTASSIEWSRVFAKAAEGDAPRCVLRFTAPLRVGRVNNVHCCSMKGLCGRGEGKQRGDFHDHETSACSDCLRTHPNRQHCECWSLQHEPNDRYRRRPAGREQGCPSRSATGHARPRVAQQPQSTGKGRAAEHRRAERSTVCEDGRPGSVVSSTAPRIGGFDQDGWSGLLSNEVRWICSASASLAVSQPPHPYNLGIPAEDKLVAVAAVGGLNHTIC